MNANGRPDARARLTEQLTGRITRRWHTAGTNSVVALRETRPASSLSAAAAAEKKNYTHDNKTKPVRWWGRGGGTRRNQQHTHARRP